MLTCEDLSRVFKKNGLLYFTGVPDSTFQEWMSYIVDRKDEFTNRIASNEGAAIGHASGYYLSTGKIGVVYMQNSGLGNCVNPITSLADPEVFGIPMILMIGWRGEPLQKDEPQHKKMGRVTIPLLDVLEIENEILEADKMEDQIRNFKEKTESQKRPVALIIKKSLLAPYEKTAGSECGYSLTREEAIKVILESFDGGEIIVSTTGKTSRELFELRDMVKSGHDHDFYTVGSMGHSSAIALEIAKQKPGKKIFVFDGDGAVIMHAGTLSTIGYYAPENLTHVVFDNNAYESTGGQPTVSDKMDMEAIALKNGYKEAKLCVTREEVQKAVNGMDKGPTMIVIKVGGEARKNLTRPYIGPRENKEAFMKKLAGP